MLKGTLLQTSNPKSLLFFSLRTPAVRHGRNGNASLPRPIAAIATYCVALALVHATYAGIASRTKAYLGRPDASRLLSRISALAFFAFGIAMLALKF
ncbi:hypothetical protein WJ78_11410 [Burkholderia ubonensis]|nr:hypothetical protein WJ78_11410 [Burkholderia ubonensis]KVR21762.1 hypothetical protein WK15_25130 [Burkholderia ubonensis]KWB53233.1 hypothetical protein WL37_05190 [Burkholderia ubonensis]KWB95266.1 hypothetical protein WL45_12430 [Burkholderia ubonensis]